ncbi:CNH-domain-containing protein [Fomes fomentarius]|nr:CNH-domain-containing protein [Fomes fomentarius]
MAKPKGRGDDMKYVVWKAPVRLEFLSLASLTVRPVQRSNTLSRMIRTGRDSPDPLSSLEHILDTINPNRDSSSHATTGTYYPFSFSAHGKHGGAYTLYASTLTERNEWRRKIREAVAARMKAQADRSVFQVETITSDTAMSQDAPAHQPGLVTGRISCSLPFTSNDGRNLIAIGSEDGVWIGIPHQPESLQRVISLKQVTQLAFLAEYGFILVLADKSLHAIDIESVVPTMSRDHGQPAFGMQKLNGDDKPVQFFSVGRQAGRTLIIYARKKGLDSVFRVLEALPFSGPSSGHRRFRTYRDFFVPSDAHDLLFLNTKVCVLCSRGFEIMDLTDFSSATIPQDEDLRRLGKRSMASRPLAMFRIREDEFLLCYDEYGLYVDKRGAPSRTPAVIEWEGVATHAAWHAPYVLLFGNSFVEIRHVESGRLAQVVTGQDIRCLWDGRGVVQSPNGQDEFDDPRTPRIHAALDDSEMATFSLHSRSHSRPRQQHVVVLTPTERLIVPGTRYSPSLLSVADTLPPYVP